MLILNLAVPLGKRGSTRKHNPQCFHKTITRARRSNENNNKKKKKREKLLICELISYKCNMKVLSARTFDFAELETHFVAFIVSHFLFLLGDIHMVLPACYNITIICALYKCPLLHYMISPSVPCLAYILLLNRH